MVKKETRVIVVVNENSKCVNVCEVRCLCIILSLDISHVGSITEDVIDGVIHGVIEECCHAALIWSYIGWISIETFSHLENTRCRPKLSPEIFWNLRDSVDSDSVEAICLNKVCNPAFELRSYKRVALV